MRIPIEKRWRKQVPEMDNVIVTFITRATKELGPYDSDYAWYATDDFQMCIWANEIEGASIGMTWPERLSVVYDGKKLIANIV